MLPCVRYHFSGIGGAGMNPLARLLAARGETVQGSDRAFDRGENAPVRRLLEEAGIAILPQDGAAVGPGLDRFVYSVAVEDDTPEMRAARDAGLGTIPRPALLAEILALGEPGIAIAGTSGKSTVTGMLAWILRRRGVEATVLGGAALAEGGATHMGCFAAAGSDAPVVAEACESDGSLVGYRPAIGLVHNLSRDHDELEGLRAQFARFAGQCRRLYYCADSAEVRALAAEADDAVGYGRAGADRELAVDAAGPWRARGRLDGVPLDLPQPGVHTLENAAAAVCLAGELGVEPADAAAALADFPGAARRFQLVGEAGGVRVIDDYAHNAAKIAAAVRAAQLGCRRLFAAFQPHGFGPARFLRDELRILLPALLRAGDSFVYLPIHYAGGTTTRDISHEDLAADLGGVGRVAAVAARDALVGWLRERVRDGDAVLLMGARDPTLPDFALEVCEGLGGKPE